MHQTFYFHFQVITLSNVKQVQKPKVKSCRTDKTKCSTHCPKCKHSKLFNSTENIWRHLWQVHQLDKYEYPSIEEVIEVLEEISIALENNIPLTTIQRAVKWGMIVK